MTSYRSDVAFTPAVKAEQKRYGSRDGYAKMQEKRDWPDAITDDLADFIAARDSFYLATASADGQPYIQHRGGKPGFLKVLDPHRLAFADFAGNRQYITLGNLSENARAHIFLMDYAARRRVKIWGSAGVVGNDPALLERLTDHDYGAAPERAIVFSVTAWDVNCPRHITRRFSEAEVGPTMQALQQRIGDLERALAAHDPSHELLTAERTRGRA